ncbi:MAG: hypothetical protein K5633_03880 [Paludibacteraceae bacterium]|nr:hypothetical protein [Paludibacteraceae bacterium]
MEHIPYFKLQAKNLLKDFKTRFFNEKEEMYCYSPTFFDVSSIFLDYEISDYDSNFSFTLMNAQHVIAMLVGFKKWDDLLKADPAILELVHLLYDNTHKINFEEWVMYIERVERDNNTRLDIPTQILIFKDVFLLSDGHRSIFEPYRLDLKKKWRSL